MAFASPSGSLPTVGRARALASSHITGESVLEGEEAGHEESETVDSANPVICPRLFMALACPLFPPSIGRALIWPFRQRNALHVRCVPKPQTSSPFGSRSFVSEKPTASPRSLISPPKGLSQLFGPPRVGRGNVNPSTFIATRPFRSFPDSKSPYWVSVHP